MVLETSVLSAFNHLTRLVARENVVIIRLTLKNRSTLVNCIRQSVISELLYTVLLESVRLNFCRCDLHASVENFVFKTRSNSSFDVLY
jgi:hypothetical protein